MWKISEYLKISAPSQPKETQSSNISRSLKLVKFLIEQVGNGFFPIMTEAQLKAAKQIQKTRSNWRISDFDPIETPKRQKFSLDQLEKVEELRKLLKENGIYPNDLD